MTAPVFICDVSSAAAGSLVRLSGSEGRHAVSVRRLTVGESLRLVDGSGVVVDAIVEEIVDKQTLEARAHRVQHLPFADPSVIVVQALPKGDRGELAVELLTEIGVDCIVPWAAERCVTQWRDDRIQKSWRKWADAAAAAAKQARRTHFPVVDSLATTDDVLELLKATSCGLILHEEAQMGISSVSFPREGTVVVVVGPEGGISPSELEAFAAAGAAQVRLGPSVLRTSSAGMAAVAAMLASTPLWATDGMEG